MPETKKYYHNLDVDNNKVINLLLNPLTTAQRIAKGGLLGPLDQGYSVYDTTTDELYFWDGTTWILSSGLTTWGSITGLITNQTDLITYLSGNYVPLNRNITINGVTYNLLADRTWTIDALPPQAGNAGEYLTTDGTTASWAPIPLPTPAALTKTDDTNVTLTLTGSPATSLLQAVGLQLGWTGTLADSRIASASNWNSKEPGITPGTVSQYWRGDKTWQTLDKNAVGLGNVENIALSTWAGSTNITTLGTITTGTWNGNAIGDTYISSASTWNAKQDAITLTTIGTSGAATFIGNTLNIPQYTDQYTGTVTSVQLAAGTGISLSGTNPITTSGTITVTNSAPDQIVALTSGTGISISGSYPSFTITNTGTYTSPLTTKGDIFVRSTVDDRLPVGTNGQILAADSSTTTGLKWIPNTATSLTNATASGTDTYTTTVPGVSAYTDGEALLIRFTNGNTTSCTLNINGLGAVPLYRNNDGPLIGGDIQAGSEMLCVYNASLPSFQCIGTSPNSLIAYITNDDSVTLTKGMAVYAFSGTGDRMTVKRANNTADATSAQTVGLVLSTSIAANQKGFIMMQGLLDGLSILPTATWNDGDPVYLGSTPGSITKVKPYAPNHLVYLGVVTTASNGAAGRMYVRVQNGYELDELHNVQAQSPSLKDTLWYDSAVSPGQWKTASISTILGYTPIPAYYQNTAPVSPIANSFWMNSDTGMLYQYVNDGDSNQWVQQTLPIGPQGPQGVSGTNNIDSLTTTPLNGILKGNGATISATTVVTELGYTPENVANKSIDGTFAANSDTLYPSQKAVKTALNNFSDDVDYAIMINQKILFNL